jgi:hypothetical protein
MMILTAAMTIAAGNMHDNCGACILFEGHGLVFLRHLPTRYRSRDLGRTKAHTFR